MSNEIDLPDVIEFYCSNPDDTLICVPKHKISVISFYRGYEKDMDKEQYVRADHYRHVSSQMHDYANQVVILSHENQKLKDEIEALNLFRDDV